MEFEKKMLRSTDLGLYLCRYKAVGFFFLLPALTLTRPLDSRIENKEDIDNFSENLLF